MPLVMALRCADASQLRACGLWTSIRGTSNAHAIRHGLPQGGTLIHASAAAAHGSHCAYSRSEGTILLCTLAQF